MQNNSIFAELKDIKNKDDLPDRSVKVYIDADEAKKTLDIQGGGGGSTKDDTIRLHINWSDPNIDNIRSDIIATWSSLEEIDQWSLLLKEDGAIYTPFNLFDDLKSGKRIIIEDFIGGVYNPTTGAWSKGLATTVEVVAKSPEVQLDGARTIFFYVVAPINPLASDFGYTPHDSSNWGPVTTCLVDIKHINESHALAQIGVDGFGYYEES